MSAPYSLHPTAKPQTVDEIRAWYVGLVQALVTQRAFFKAAIRSGALLPVNWVGASDDDIEDWFDGARTELDHLTVLNLVACVEAELVRDFFRRVQRRLRDNLARVYRTWHKTLEGNAQHRPPFDGILRLLRNANVIDNHLIGRYRECRRVRNWVGHGRYYARPAHIDHLDPDEVSRRADALLAALPD